MTDYRSLIKDVWKSGGKAYLVGGWVRDSLLKRKSEDIDIEVLGIKRETFEEIAARYGKYYRCGKTYEIYILNHDIEISFIEEDIPLEKTGRRRDFTVNAIYYDIIKNKLIDPFNGMKDLEEERLKPVNRSTFMEDPLRLMRGAELAGRLGFHIDDSEMEYFRGNSHRMDETAPERIAEELKKIYLHSQKPSVAFRVMDEMGILRWVETRMDSLKEVIQDDTYHPEGDVYTHILMMLDVLPLEKRSMEVFWGIIYHDLGKGETYPDFKGHAEVSREIFLKEGKRLVRNKREARCIEALIRYHEEPLNLLIQGISRIKIRKLAARVDMEKLLDLYTCDILGRGRPDNLEELQVVEEIERIYLEIKDELKPIVMGRHLKEWGLEEERTYGDMLEYLYEKQLEEKFYDLEGARALYLRKLKA